jgi:hypothetical protein
MLIGLVLALAACGSSNPSFALSVAHGLHPRLTADDAIRISRDYLDQQTPQLAAPELHRPPMITGVWAVPAVDAPSLDGCIPTGHGAQLVWVTKGQGDYLNLRDYPWSINAGAPRAGACQGPGPEGTLVIDDATGQILGVYPLDIEFPHPTASTP